MLQKQFNALSGTLIVSVPRFQLFSTFCQGPRHCKFFLVHFATIFVSQSSINYQTIAGHSIIVTIMRTTNYINHTHHLYGSSPAIVPAMSVQAQRCLVDRVPLHSFRFRACSFQTARAATLDKLDIKINATKRCLPCSGSCFLWDVPWAVWMHFPEYLHGHLKAHSVSFHPSQMKTLEPQTAYATVIRFRSVGVR